MTFKERSKTHNVHISCSGHFLLNTSNNFILIQKGVKKKCLKRKRSNITPTRKESFASFRFFFFPRHIASVIFLMCHFFIWFLWLLTVIVSDVNVNNMTAKDHGKEDRLILFVCLFVLS